MNARDDHRTASLVLRSMLERYEFHESGEVEHWLGQASDHPSFNTDDISDINTAARVLRSPVGWVKIKIGANTFSSISESDPRRGAEAHPLVRVLRRHNDILDLGEEISHALETDDRDRDLRYSSVVTIRSVPSSGIALSAQRLPLHQDGLGTCGSVRYIAMFLDQAAITGGEHLYVNLLAHGIRLAAQNWDRFVAATRPNALTITRFRGAQKVSVTGPMFYVDASGTSAAHFRSTGGEYVAEPSPEVAPWFEDFARQLEAAAVQVKLREGECVLLDNLVMAHARTASWDSTRPRRLSRKWYAISPQRSHLTGQPHFLLQENVHGRQY